MLVYRIGSEDRPATESDIRNFDKKLNKAGRKKVDITTPYPVSLLKVPDSARKVVWQIGTSDRPAGPKDVKAFRKALLKARSTGQSLITHHAVEAIVLSKKKE